MIGPSLRLVPPATAHPSKELKKACGAMTDRMMELEALMLLPAPHVEEVDLRAKQLMHEFCLGLARYMREHDA